MSLAPPANPFRLSTGANRDYRLLLMYSTSSDESVHSACGAERAGTEYYKVRARVLPLLGESAGA